MRIAFITPHMIIGGAETYILTKSRWLVKHGHSVVVVSDGGMNVENLPGDVKHIHFQTEISPASFSSKDYETYIAGLSNLLLSEKVDVIEAHNTSPIVHVAMCYPKTKIPYFINILNERSYFRNPLLNKITTNIAPYKLCYTLTPQMASYVSSRVGKKVEATILPIPMKGIDPDGEKYNGNYILSVCRMAPDKMYVKYLIENVRLLLRDGRIGNQYKLLLVGEGDLFNEVRKIATEANRALGKIAIEMLGTVTGKELEKLYRGAALYVGTGTSLLLAASCGKPCIIPGFTRNTMPYAWGIWGERESDKDVLSVSELQNYSRSGYADIIEKLLKNESLRNRLGKQARDLFERYYDLTQIMSRWEMEYGRIIEIFSEKTAALEIAQKSDIRPTIRFYRPLWKLRQMLKH